MKAILILLVMLTFCTLFLPAVAGAITGGEMPTLRSKLVAGWHSYWSDPVTKWCTIVPLCLIPLLLLSLGHLGIIDKRIKTKLDRVELEIKRPQGGVH